MSIIQNRGIKFINKITNGYVSKITNGIDPDIGFISNYRNIDLIDGVLDKINLTISGQFNSINNDISTDAGGIAFVTPDGIEFWGDDAEEILGTCPLIEFKELLIAWKTFFQSPPFDRSLVK